MSKSEQLDFDTIPVKPYNNTSGHNQSETSRERAEWRDNTGITANNQIKVMKYLDKAGPYGVIYHDLNDLFGWGSQNSSNVLSNLHAVGEIVRIKERRNRCYVYVLERFVEGREVSPFKGHVCKCPDCGWIGRSQ